MPKRKGIQSSEELRDDLECPVCLQIPKSVPIYQCEAGHIHCKKCHPQLQDCPVCRGPIGNMRSLMTEKIIAKLPAKCSFTEYGCLADEKIPEDMLLHEKECNFRLVKCLLCAEDVPVSDHFDHCKLKHQSHHTSLDQHLPFKFRIHSQRLQTPGGFRAVISKPRFIKGEKQSFAMNIKGDESGYLCVNVFILGTQADIDNEKYQCKLQVENASDEKVKNIDL